MEQSLEAHEDGRGNVLAILTGWKQSLVIYHLTFADSIWKCNVSAREEVFHSHRGFSPVLVRSSQSQNRFNGLQKLDWYAAENR